MSHTPGPWGVGEGNWSSRVVAPVRYSTEPKEVGVFAGRGRAEDEANARLCAAAPEMLEALRFWLDYQGDNCDADFEPIARAAIAKAEGK